jgi:hypothetical protein
MPCTRTGLSTSNFLAAAAIPQGLPPGVFLCLVGTAVHNLHYVLGLLRPQSLRTGRAEPVDIMGIASKKLHYVMGSALAPAAVLALRSRSNLWE